MTSRSLDYRICQRCGTARREHLGADLSCPAPAKPNVKGYRLPQFVQHASAHTKRIGMSFSVDQVASLAELLRIVARGGDARVVARRKAVQEAMTIVASAKRRLESQLESQVVAVAGGEGAERVSAALGSHQPSVASGRTLQPEQPPKNLSREQVLPTAESLGSRLRLVPAEGENQDLRTPLGAAAE